MLEIKNINISYNSHPILNAEQFKAPNTGLCTIYGESGSGKTSLLKSILLEEHQFDQYLYNGKVIRKKNMEKFRNEHISSLSQSSILIEDLKVKDHFKLFKRNNAYIKKLKLNKLLDKYPSQLSGGEKTRVGLVLAMMQNKPILILDEPTASLDSEMARVVIHLIKEYSTNHLVIVSTHDRNMLAVADCIYHIQDKKLILDQYEEKVGKIKATSHFKLAFKTKLQLFHNLNKRKRVSHILMQLLLIVSISFTSFGLSKIVSGKNDDASLSNLLDDEIFVYKMVDQDIVPIYTHEGSEFPFTNDEKESVKSLNHVSKVEEHFSVILENSIYLPELMDGIQHENLKWLFTLYNKNGDKLISSQFPEVNHYNFPINLSTYNEDKNYDSFILKKGIEENGVYISNEFAKELKIDLENENYYLEFELYVPQYVAYNDVFYSDSNNEVPACRLLGVSESVKLPISGVLVKSNMGAINCGKNAIYVPSTLMNSYIEKYKVTKAIDYVSTDAGYVLHNGEETTARIMHCEPYSTNALIVTVDNVSNKNEVISEIEKLGFTVSGDSSQFLINQFANNSESNRLIMAYTSFSLICIVYFVLKYLNLKNERQFVSFFEQLGWSYKSSRNLVVQKYIFEGLIMMMSSLLFSFIYFKVSYYMKFYLFSAEYSYIPIIIALALLISFVYPTVLLCLKGERK